MKTMIREIHDSETLIECEEMVKMMLVGIWRLMEEARTAVETFNKRPSIVTGRRVQETKDKVEDAVKNATGVIQREWESKYSNLVTQDELHQLTQALMTKMIENKGKFESEDEDLTTEVPSGLYIKNLNRRL